MLIKYVDYQFLRQAANKFWMHGELRKLTRIKTVTLLYFQAGRMVSGIENLRTSLCGLCVFDKYPQYSTILHEVI